MTKTQILLEEVREKLGGVTDYRLAKTLDIPRPRVHEYVRGMNHADAYAATKIAIELGRDPLEIIAEIESEAATTEAKRTFWRSFHSGLTQALFGGALLLTGGFFAPGQTGASEMPGSHNVYYVK